MVVQQGRVIGVSKARWLGRALLVALLLTCFLGLQSVSAIHEHRDADHFCPVCSASHLPVIPAVAIVHFSPPTAVIWQGIRDTAQRPTEHFAALRPSRGPPASSFSI